jgi:FKBP-type peptidyl-prolyl cis-trans isomerase
MKEFFAAAYTDGQKSDSPYPEKEPTDTSVFSVTKLTEGTPGGKHPPKGRQVTMHYTGKLLDGTVFDSSIERDRPFKF